LGLSFQARGLLVVVSFKVAALLVGDDRGGAAVRHELAGTGDAHVISTLK
jgi:hypothetical protein